MKEVVLSYYEALHDEDFKRAYSYFDRACRDTSKERDFAISKQQPLDTTSANIGSLEVSGIAGTATASAELSSGEDGSASYSRVTWHLVREDGGEAKREAPGRACELRLLLARSRSITTGREVNPVALTPYVTVIRPGGQATFARNITTRSRANSEEQSRKTPCSRFCFSRETGCARNMRLCG